jgi:hypothetical protein
MVVCSIIPGKDLFGGEILFNCWINSKAIHDGQTCSDPFGMIFGWGESLHNLPPISFPSEKKQHVTIQNSFYIAEISTCFHLPLSSLAYRQLLILTSDLETLNISDKPDIYGPIFGRVGY